MKAKMMTQKRMCCCCCSDKHMVRSDKERRVHIISIYQERTEYEEEHFYDSFDFRAAA